MVTQLEPSKHAQGSAGNKDHRIDRLVSPLLAVYDVMVGPPMSERQRNRRAIVESRLALDRESGIFGTDLWR